MSFRVLLASVVAALLTGPAAVAQEEVWVRGQEKPATGVIKAESPKGIHVGKDLIPADAIVDVVYKGLMPLELRLKTYTPAVKAEKDAADPANEAKHKALLAEALKNYEETLAKMAADKGAKRHLEYKVAALQARQAQAAGANYDPAIARLKDFVEKNPGSWQVTAAVRTLAELHAAKKEFAEAADAYRRLTALDVADDAKQEAELLALQVALRGGDAGAKGQLDALVAKLPKESRYAARARILQAEALLASKDEKQMTKAVDALRAIIKDATDRQVKAEAHNALGEHYFHQEQYKDARWEFLWVDVVYNQDKAEHARALYRLWQTFEKLGDAERAQECRETLLSERQFTGLEHQRLAQRTAKTAQP